jgi:ornithine cyclodeaminase/alanine dehydrogenase-like protein (mu-crystallin family)
VIGYDPGIRIVGAAELRAHVGFEDLIEPISAAFRESSAGAAANGLVVMYPLEQQDRGDVYVKTGTLRGHSIFIVKVSPWFAQNVENGAAQGGFVAVFDSSTGRTIALLNEEHYLSDIRTAAAGALAARVFAPSSVRTAAVLGAGVQAYWQTLALHRERPFARLLIWARDADKALMLKSRLAKWLAGVDLRVEERLERAVRDADVLICATMAREPLVRGEWLREGQHITAVGADDPGKCELDAVVLQRARVFVDSLDTAAANGDIHRAIAARRYTRGELSGEIGEVLAGTKVGRFSPSDITVAKFVGIGAQDLAAAETCLAKLGISSPPPRIAEQTSAH